MERQVETTIKRVLKCNTEDRTALAHSLLQPNTDGSIDVRHGKATEVKWSRDAFAAKIEQLDKLADEAEGAERRTTNLQIHYSGFGLDANQQLRADDGDDASSGNTRCAQGNFAFRLIVVRGGRETRTLGHGKLGVGRRSLGGG